MSTAIEDFDFSVNILSALIWRNNQAVNLQSLLQSKQNWYDQNHEQFWNDWITNVFNVDTANEFGLSVWAQILGVPLQLIAPANVGPQFGFGPDNAGHFNGRYNFNRGNFGVSQAGVGLTIDQKRIIIKLQYLKLTTRCTIPELNSRIKAILGNQGGVYVLDANNMSYTTYVFEFVPNSQLAFVLENFDVLPRPAAVGVRYVIATGNKVFGFGLYNQNFNNGNFLTGSINAGDIRDTSDNPILDTSGNPIESV